jgi:hypothetical protein
MIPTMKSLEHVKYNEEKMVGEVAVRMEARARGRSYLRRRTEGKNGRRMLNRAATAVAVAFASTFHIRCSRDIYSNTNP